MRLDPIKEMQRERRRTPSKINLEYGSNCPICGFNRSNKSKHTNKCSLEMKKRSENAIY